MGAQHTSTPENFASTLAVPNLCLCCPLVARLDATAQNRAMNKTGRGRALRYRRGLWVASGSLTCSRPQASLTGMKELHAEVILPSDLSDSKS